MLVPWEAAQRAMAQAPFQAHELRLAPGPHAFRHRRAAFPRGPQVFVSLLTTPVCPKSAPDSTAQNRQTLLGSLPKDPGAVTWTLLFSLVSDLSKGSAVGILLSTAMSFPKRFLLLIKAPWPSRASAIASLFCKHVMMWWQQASARQSAFRPPTHHS